MGCIYGRRSIKSNSSAGNRNSWWHSGRQSGCIPYTEIRVQSYWLQSMQVQITSEIRTERKILSVFLYYIISNQDPICIYIHNYAYISVQSGRICRFPLSSLHPKMIMFSTRRDHERSTLKNKRPALKRFGLFYVPFALPIYHSYSRTLMHNSRKRKENKMKKRR